MVKKGLVLVHGDYSSHTTRPLAIAERLRETGEVELIFSGSGHHMDLPRKKGFECVETSQIPKSHVADVLHKNFIPLIYTQEITMELSRIERELLEKYKPDFIIRDYLREVAGIHAKAKGITDIKIEQGFSSPNYQFDFLPGNAPAFLRYMPEGLLERMGGFVERFVRKSATKHLHELSRSLGNPYDPRTTEGVYPDLTLIAELPKFFPNLSKHNNQVYIGPLLVMEEREKPPWIDEFSSSERMKIVISSGTTGNHENSDLYFKTFEGEDWVVANYCNTTNTRPPSNFFGNSPFYLPAVIPYADLFIHHGGMGSTYLGLSEGVPMIVTYNHLEQNLNGVQIERGNAGLSVSSRGLTPRRLLELSQKVLGNHNFRAGAQHFSDLIKSRTPAQEIAKKLILDLLNVRN